MVEVLAWLVVGLAVIFGILPALGSIFTGYGSKYSDDLIIGLCMALFLVLLCSVIGAVMWAFSVVTA